MWVYIENKVSLHKYGEDIIVYTVCGALTPPSVRRKWFILCIMLNIARAGLFSTLKLTDCMTMTSCSQWVGTLSVTKCYGTKNFCTIEIFTLPIIHVQWFVPSTDSIFKTNFDTLCFYIIGKIANQVNHCIIKRSTFPFKNNS